LKLTQQLTGGKKQSEKQTSLLVSARNYLVRSAALCSLHPTRAGSG